MVQPQFQNQNMFYQEGDTDTTDMDVVNTLKLNPNVAGTPDINEAAIRKAWQDNVKGFMAKGYNQQAAIKMANQRADMARSRVKAAMNQ